MHPSCTSELPCSLLEPLAHGHGWRLASQPGEWDVYLSMHPPPIRILLFLQIPVYIYLCTRREQEFKVSSSYNQPTAKP
jgi:hypothetical protein